ncbi:MAG TPA: hypothetical protein VGX23_33555 [Actinocrinis sp.]|nr:hypothetical protein [Actinocrinis sp.]
MTEPGIDIAASDAPDSAAADTDGEARPAAAPDEPEEPDGPEASADQPEKDWSDGWDRIHAWAQPRQNALVAALVYLLGALVVTRHLWPHPATILNAANPGDQIKFEWMLGEAARSLLHPHNPLFSSTLGAASVNGGTNLIANTSVLLLGYLFSPVTLLLGAGASYLLIITGNFLATALVWRWFFRTHVTDNESAAFLGGLFLGFSPAMMSHALGHPNLTAQWLIPIMLHLILRMYRSEHRIRDGVILGALVFAQFFIAEEPLLLLAVGLVIFLAGCVIFNPRLIEIHWRGMLTGGVSALGTAVVLLAYPLYFQFDGPRSFIGVPFLTAYYSQDLAGYLQFPNQSLGGSLTAPVYAPGATEQAALFGGPLVLLFLVACIALAHRTAVRASLLSVLGLVALSLGPTVHIAGKASTLPAIWQHLENQPAFEDSLPVRMAMAITPFVGYLLVIIVEYAMRAPKPWRLLGYAVIAAALVPLTPRPIVGVQVAPTPAFFTQGDYKSCISGGRSLVTVPSDSWSPLLWTASLTDDVPLAQAPFVYPDGAPDNKAVFGSAGLTTFSILGSVESSGTYVPVTPETKSSVDSDLKYWNAGCVILPHSTNNYGALREELDNLLGQATVYDDIDVWSVSR